MQCKERGGHHFHQKLENLKSALSNIKTNLKTFKNRHENSSPLDCKRSNLETILNSSTLMTGLNDDNWNGLSVPHVISRTIDHSNSIGT